MQNEHTMASDSEIKFTSGNYNVTTTPLQEWTFVVEPDTEGIDWPVEEKLTAESGNMRVPMPMAKLKTKLAEVNERLKTMNEPELGLDEGFGARL
jgi:hypothetical protein